MSKHAHTLFWANLAAFDDRKDAEELQAHLARQGVDAQVYDERRLQRWWFLARPKAGVRVQVPSRNFHQVAELVNGDSAAKVLLKRAVQCPSCQSLKVEYPQMSRRCMLPTLGAHFLVFLGVMKHCYYCEDCHHTWTRNRAVPARQPVRVT